MLKLYVALQTRLTELRDREHGQAMAEYGVILAGIAIVVLATIFLLGDEVNDAFEKVKDKIATVA
jgi:pilus assembly protein Flp/PilA